MSFKRYIDFLNDVLNETLVTFGGKAYPKYGNVVLLGGGAGSGKGFVLSKLLGIEGKVFDVDALKTFILKNPSLLRRFLQYMLEKKEILAISGSVENLDLKFIVSFTKNILDLTKENPTDMLSDYSIVQELHFFLKRG
jgi:hypothetical protein